MSGDARICKAVTSACQTRRSRRSSARPFSTCEAVTYYGSGRRGGTAIVWQFSDRLAPSGSFVYEEVKTGGSVRPWTATS